MKSNFRFRLLLFMGFVFSKTLLFAHFKQNKDSDSLSNKNAQNFQSASFPGGEDSLSNFLMSHTKYPQTAIEDDRYGKVVLSFLINENGAVEDVRILRDIGGGCGHEAIRVIKNMPHWIPAKYKGKPVKSLVEYPIQFRIGD